MNRVPYFFDHVNAVAGQWRPSTVRLRDNYNFNFFRRSLLQRAMAVFEWKIPENWDRDFFLFCLYENGVVCVLNTPEFGVIPQPCGLAGYNVFYNPARCLVTNPLLGTKDLKIGKDCEIIKLQPDFGGICDTVNYYAELLALATESVEMNLINTKSARVFGAKTKAIAESYKKMTDKIMSGEPAVFVSKDLFNEDGSLAFQDFTDSVTSTYITDKLLNDIATIFAKFDTEIGLNNANTEKKERLIVSEVESNNEAIKARPALWLESIKKGIEKTKKMFPEIEEFSVDWRFREEGKNVNNDVNDDRTIQYES